MRFGLRSEVAGRSKAGADVSAESICNHSSVVRVEAMLLSTCERGKMGQLECVKEGPDRGLTRYVRCLGTAPPLRRRNTQTGFWKVQFLDRSAPKCFQCLLLL